MKKPFRKITNKAVPTPTPVPQSRELTVRDVQIMANQIAVMTRQNGDMAAQLALAEATNRQLIDEHQQMRAEIESLQKGKKG